MNSTRALVVLALGAAAFVAACEEDSTIPPPPDPPEQISYTRSYVQSSTGLGSNDVTAFLKTTDGKFWVGTRAGVSRYPSVDATTREALINEINGLPHPQVTSLVERDDFLFVGTWGGGLGVYNLATDQWTQIRVDPLGLANGFISGMALSETENLIYMSTNDGVYIYDQAGDWEFVSTVDSLLADPEDTETPAIQQVVSCVEVTEDLGVVQRWYGPRVEIRLSDKLKPLHGIIVSKSATSYKYTNENSGLIEPNVNDVFFDEVSNEHWVAYATKGISSVDVTTSIWTSYGLTSGLPSLTVYAIARARDNANSESRIWAATQDGLVKLVNGKFQSYGVSGGLPSNRVKSLYSDDGVHLWVGFVDAGAVRIH